MSFRKLSEKLSEIFREQKDSFTKESLFCWLVKQPPTSNREESKNDHDESESVAEFVHH